MLPSEVYTLQQDSERDPENVEARQTMLKAQAEAGGVVFCIAEENMEKVEKKLTALNKRAAKIGCEPITLTKTGETVTLSYTTDHWSTRPVTFLHRYCILKGSAPKIEGYTIVGHIAHTDAGAMMSRLPITLQDGEQIRTDLDLSEWVDADPVCDHCQWERQRNDTFLVADDETGAIKQIGRNCLKDFTGSSDPERMARALEFYWDFCRYAGEPAENPVMDLAEYLAHVAMTVRMDGYYRKGGATRDAAQQNYWNKATGKKRNGAPQWVDPSEEDYRKAERVIAWLGEQSDPANEFVYKLHKAASLDYVAERTEGLLAYARVAYDRAMEREARQQPTLTPEKGWIGQVKSKVEVKAKLVKTVSVSSIYAEDGTKPLYIFEDADGNEIKWFASRWQGLDNGEQYTVAGTVKEHCDHERFGKATMLTRCKVTA